MSETFTKTVFNPKTGQSAVFHVERDRLTCPVCGIEVEYLVGEDIGDGRQGCEACWRPPTTPPPSFPRGFPSSAGRPVPQAVEPSGDQLTEFDQRAKEEFGQSLPKVSAPAEVPQNDFQRFRDSLIAKARETEKGGG